MDDLLKNPHVLMLISLALQEDLGDGDVTTSAIFGVGDRSTAVVMAKERGILCGGPLASLVYRQIDPGIEVVILKEDGAPVSEGQAVLSIRGRTRGILSGERTVLNFLQRMSGIATKTGRICALISGTGIRILDTRKTIPGFRLLDKYAVKTGGGTNHRMGLYDMVMIKDNHIRAAGGIGPAVEKIKSAYGSRYRVEVEATTLAETREALAAGADIIMLDNMDIETMRSAVEIVAGRAKTEISGNVDEERIEALKTLKVDYISIGALTHSVKAFDLSMKFD
jgi:nicotinate-nucleotide pyrophosphorylase (carboxylating)